MVARLQGFVIAVCLLATSAYAAEPAPAPAPQSPPPASPSKVDGIALEPANPTVAPSDGFVVIEAKTTGAVVRWAVVTNSTIPVKYSIIGKLLFVNTPPGAVIYVSANTLLIDKDGKSTITEHAQTVITVTNAAVPTGPNQSPNPNQPPVPPSGILVLLVYDQAKKTPDLNRVITSTSLNDALKQAGHKYVPLTVDDPEVSNKKLMPWVVKAGGTPALIVMRDLGNGNGRVLAQQPVPVSEQEFLNVVNKAASSK